CQSQHVRPVWGIGNPLAWSRSPAASSKTATRVGSGPLMGSDMTIFRVKAQHAAPYSAVSASIVPGRRSAAPRPRKNPRPPPTHQDGPQIEAVGLGRGAPAYTPCRGARGPTGIEDYSAPLSFWTGIAGLRPPFAGPRDQLGFGCQIS